MVGITLTPEQIRSAPADVRRWLEHEVATSLGFQRETEPTSFGAPHLVACTPDEAGLIYAAVRGMLPVVNVFFELGREGKNASQNGVEVHLLIDILRHTRLRSIEQLAACLQMIDDAVRQIKRDPAAAICALDRRGYCLIATETRQSIAHFWSQLLAEHDHVSTTPQDTGRQNGQTIAKPSDDGTMPPAYPVEADADRMPQSSIDAFPGL